MDELVIRTREIRRTTVVMVALLLVMLLFSQPATAVPALKAVPSPGDEAGVKAVLDDYYAVRKDATAAVSIGYFDADDSTSAHYGFVDIDNHVPATKDSVYEWGSVTKMLVWVALMQLHEQQLVDLDAQASDYLGGTDLRFEQPFTVTDLMNHQAGFAENPYPPETTEAEQLMTLDAALRHYQPRQIYEPGTVTSYSNYGAALAAYIVERITGQRFAEYVRSEIFEPLDMTETAIEPDRGDNPVAAERRADNKSYALMEGVKEHYGAALAYIHLYPAGSATGTLDDFMTFGRALVPGTEESRAVFSKPETLEKFMSGTLVYSGTDIVQNSYGMWSLPYGGGLLGHGGNTQGYTSTLFIDPQALRGLVVMTNEVGETSYTYGLLEEFFGDYDIDPASLGEGEGTDIAGVYTNARANIPYDANRFLRYLGGILPLVNDGESGNYRLMVGPGTVKRVGGNVHLMDSGNGLRTLLVLADEPDGQVLQTYTGDNFKEHTVLFGLAWGTVLVFLLLSVISLVVVVVGLVRRAWRALNRTRANSPRARKPLDSANWVFHMLQAALGAAVFALLFVALGTDPTLSRVLAIVIGVLTLALVGVWLTKPIRRVRPGVFVTIVLLVSVLNVGYWRWFLA